MNIHYGEHLRRYSPALSKEGEIPYGREAYSIALDFGMKQSEAQELIDEWFKLYPEAAMYLNQCAEDAAVGKVLVTPFGRHRRFGLVTPDNLHATQNEARNFRVQSVSSDLTLISANYIRPKLVPYNAFIINLVHDSIVVECPNDLDTIREVSSLIREEMMATPLRELKCVIPFETDTEVGPSWGALETYKTKE